MNKSSLRNLCLWLTFCLLLGGVPAIILYSTISRHLSLLENDHFFSARDRVNQAAVQSRLNADQETYWCRFFHSNQQKFFEAKAEPEQVISWLSRIKLNFDDEFDFLAWDRTGKVVKQTFSSQHSAEEWQKVFRTLARYYPLARQIDYAMKMEPDVEAAKKILGQQYLPEAFMLNFDDRLYSLAHTDATMEKPACLAFFLDHGGYLLLFDHNKFENLSGLKNFLKNFAMAGNHQLGLYKPTKKLIWTSFISEDNAELLKLLEECETEQLGFIKKQNQYFFYRHISGDLRLFMKAPQLYSDNIITLYAIAGAVLFLLLLLPVFNFLFKTIARSQPGNVSIRLKLTFLFAFASGMPLLVLGIISQENYAHKRNELMNLGKEEVTSLIVNFDNRFDANLSAIAASMKNYLEILVPELKRQGFNSKILDKTLNKMRQQNAGNFYIVSSDTREIMSNHGLFKLRGNLEDSTIDLENSDTRQHISELIKSDLKTANLVGKKLLSDLNNTPFPMATISKLELVAETLMQKPFKEILHSIISNFNNLGLWGFGRALDYGFSKLISLNNNSEFDYLALIFWRPLLIQTHYVQESISKLARNRQGIKVIAIRNGDDKVLPENENLSSELNAFSKTLIDKPNEDIQIITLDQAKYIAIGFQAQKLSNFKLIGLYPLAEIDRQIEQQRTEIMLFSAFCLLFAVGLAQTLFRSFLRPVDALKNGALAIEERNFKHRVQIANKDEFGQIAGIFNNVMVGLEELEVAKIVQESLFPPPSFSQKNFAVFGKSITMSELGGDYFDFIKINDNSFAVLMGDVAGHGVGAAVLMAMAKAAVLNSPDLLEKPAELLLNLHQMILAAKSSKQRKVMTFQYLCVSCSEKSGVYANAGACSPFILEDNGSSIRELTLPGAALGAFKKAKYQSTGLQFKKGDAIVFYTDGIIETRSAGDEEIGYEGFRQILLDSYDPDPEKFHEKVLNCYHQHLGNLDAQDDLTIMIMLCKE